ncbi:unnamed protein product [Heligmosomoides polygyrus]|uniref:Uncharacterized protein n=1 Tax=Heligmosomoides polygyrus TaxID=6339 RepID=A0A183FXQ9_HELPZ|nr:unnamed protein product [Heligmosomoides polygyrus]
MLASRRRSDDDVAIPNELLPAEGPGLKPVVAASSSSVAISSERASGQNSNRATLALIKRLPSASGLVRWETD